MTAPIYTFGYEGLTMDAFLHRLLSVGVEQVVDVRAVPLSRKKGFSKKSFATALNRVEIAYIHVPALGCPKSTRDRYRADGDWTLYTSSFLQYLDSQEAALAELAKISVSLSSCLVCFEADYLRCHRTYVARALAEWSAFNVMHLTIKRVIPDQFERQAA